VTDNRDFDQILDICLDRLQTGATLADCLASYPQHAAQLAPLLQIASRLETPAGPTMSDQGLRAGEARLLAQAARLRARRKASTLPVTGLIRRLAAAGIAGLVLVCGMLGVGTVSAASLPDSPLYPIKQATEAVVTWAAFTPQWQTTVHLAWAERRLDEAEALLARDGTVDPAVLAALERETDQALAAAEQSGPEQLAAVAAQTEHHQAVLQAVLDKAPAAARPGLERAITASANGHARAESALDKAKPAKATKEHPGNSAQPPLGSAQPPFGTGTPPAEMESPTGSAQPPSGSAQPPSGTPPAKPTKEHPDNSAQPPRGTPPGQDKKQSTPTPAEQVSDTPTAPSATDTVEPTPTDVVETPTSDNSQETDKEKKDKEDKEKKDKKDKKDKDK
jgi:hypothetical protein